MMNSRQWTLGAKLALVALPFLLAALGAMATLVYMSWQIEGGAAAVNEAGRMRMRTFRIVMSASEADTKALQQQVAEFERSLQLLRSGDAERPLFVPWDSAVRERFALVERDWVAFRGRLADARPSGVAAATGLGADAAAFTLDIDAFVAGIEAHLSRWTALMHLLQVAMMGVALIGAAVLVQTGYRFVLEPLGLLNRTIHRLQGGDLGARVARTSTDEFGTLAEGFNGMADQLQSMYRSLESRVREKTAQLEEERGRLECLYEVTTLTAKATTLDELAHGFTGSIARIAHADGVALRWSDEANRRYLMLASQGLPQAMTDAEHCVVAGDCHCGSAPASSGARVISIRTMQPARIRHCAQAGFETVVSIPIRLHERLMGEVDLFFHARITISEAERSLLESLTVHLAGAMENLRLSSLGLEAAISQERGLLARELHDSIAQSLAFLKIQVQLMRDALAAGDGKQVQHVLGEIDIGVRESYGDVRELLMHFRTRTNGEDIEPALLTTLRKFEHQSGLKASLQMLGEGMPLAPDTQIQVLHIVQEALSNVRKHARASKVWLDVRQAPQWRLEVRDDGTGFADGDGAPDETHVGMRIMAERAERLGAQLDVISSPGRGTSVVLTLPLPPGNGGMVATPPQPRVA
ncbi:MULTISPECIES: type IV pili methyl-accepting chemotaxis transducer N-terminal domain-containing protein [unclassified Variovorax]|uniref:type IV pili methyl-accepting chemotaxis transducer N-terminal domain-containing protein n=1 Tax=unclassified Variovorax TaxID=663243 RepID=UPI00076D70D9|nr:MULTISPECIES: type IV pili methyl-accepting chemotaxis transducer N-terminal domain-containing protein [unclassified Variovorax]KWT96802.1 Nitrate/nitrite sensor protein [Variovorax sp. WDL1]PNG47215.1 Nitrate/nitrite sensor protein NarX [Variovorax sp. B2]PNG48134.1 Nitrate/nitrite sensor protein NarX [Variovorax sp. B4]VTV15098.1 Nitrate/nitrite sensor protein NarX [Variovorax sp. WDL1]